MFIKFDNHYINMNHIVSIRVEDAAVIMTGPNRYNYIEIHNTERAAIRRMNEIITLVGCNLNKW